MRKSTPSRKATILVGASLLGFAHAKAPSHTVVPFVLKGDHLIVVQGSIGPIENLKLVIDTGATATVVTPRLAKRLSLKGQPKQIVAYGKKMKVQEVTLPSLELGELSFTDTTAQVAPLEFPGMEEQVRIDALVGLNILRNTGLVIDYEARKLVFGPVTHSQPQIYFYNKFPFVPVSMSVGGRRANLMLDTGARDLILFERRVEGRLPMKRTDENIKIRSLRGKSALRKVLLSDLSLGKDGWAELPAYLLDSPSPITGMDGILGALGLGLKRLNLDFENSCLSLER